MRIRKYMVIGVLFIVVFPWIVFILLSLIGSHAWTTHRIQQVTLTHTMQMIAQNEHNWTNPNWQHQMAAELQRQGIDVEIRSPSNRVIFEFGQPDNRYWKWNDGSTWNHHWTSADQMFVMNDGKWVGTVQLFQPPKVDPIAAMGAILACVLAIVFVSFQIGRNVIKPLESMSQAALQIAEGDLDFELASSNALEIRRVRTAFQAMVKGLRDSFAKQQRLEEERKFFIGAIAHDLRTPLFSLRGYLDGIEQGIASSPEQIAHYVAVCRDKAAHLERLVSDLFAFTRLEYMEQTLQKEHFNLVELVNTIIESASRKVQEKKIVIDAKTLNDVLFISGDPHLLERAVTNLMDNAIRHTPNGGRIMIELQKEPERVVLKIFDTGLGFSHDDLAHIFEPMYRGDKSRNLSTGGAGLGLTIARRIFLSHGGELFAENSPNGGAVLTGWLPTQSR